MPLTAEEHDFLLSEAARLSVDLGQAEVLALGTYVEQLELWSRQMNLLKAESRTEILQRHVIDSLAVVPLVRAESEKARIVDIGSGAGLPGVPVAIACPTAKVTLLEPRRKRANFLREVSRRCSTWNIAVEASRVEAFALLYPGEFDVALSRAALAPSKLAGQAAPLLRSGGLLVGFTTRQTPATSEPRPDFMEPKVAFYSLPGAEKSLTLTSWRRR